MRSAAWSCAPWPWKLLLDAGPETPDLLEAESGHHLGHHGGGAGDILVAVGALGAGVAHLHQLLEGQDQLVLGRLGGDDLLTMVL